MLKKADYEVYPWLDKLSEEYKDTESVFDKAYEIGNKEEMFKCIHRVTYAIILKLIAQKGLKGIDANDASITTTCDLMERMLAMSPRVKTPYKPRHLTSWCYLPCLNTLFGPKQRRIDKEVSLDSLAEEFYITELEGDNDDEIY